MRSSDNWLSDDRITRETLSNNNPCPSSPSSTILRFCLYGIEHSTARLATLTKYIYIYIYIYVCVCVCVCITGVGSGGGGGGGGGQVPPTFLTGGGNSMFVPLHF